MAMRECPNCGERISERAAKCPHCGHEMIPERMRICAECGTELENGMTACPRCGCPVEIGQGTPQEVEVAGVKISAKNKKLLIGIFAAVLVVIIATVGFKQLRAQHTDQSYGENLQLAASFILTDSANAETYGNLIKSVWYNAIYQIKDPETDKYTCPYGYFFDDFNEAIAVLLADYEFKPKLTELEERTETAEAMMRNLTDPPEEYERAYDELSKFYRAYLDFIEIVTNPEGSLSTFSDEFEDADKTVLRCYENLSIYLE